MGTINMTRMCAIMCLGKLTIPWAANGEADAYHSNAQLNRAIANWKFTRSRASSFDESRP